MLCVVKYTTARHSKLTRTTVYEVQKWDREHMHSALRGEGTFSVVLYLMPDKNKHLHHTS